MQLESLDIYASFKRSKYLSVKHSSYFQVYEELFSRFRNTRVVFVEVGVLNGGSLFMWRDYFGPEARIIGIDLNPLAKKWEADGFEIHIGDQGDARFWEEFFSVVGDVDVVLDDGGHTNAQQIVTADQCIPRIRNRGMLVIEDTHASYLKAFGNPSRYSFINYAKRMIDRLHTRFPELRARDQSWEKAVYSMQVFESIVCFHVDREKCFVSAPILNDGISADAVDFRHHGTKVESIKQLRTRLGRRFSYLARVPLLRATQRIFFDTVLSLHARIKARALKKYFS